MQIKHRTVSNSTYCEELRENENILGNKQGRITLSSEQTKRECRQLRFLMELASKRVDKSYRLFLVEEYPQRHLTGEVMYASTNTDFQEVKVRRMNRKYIANKSFRLTRLQIK